MRPPTDEDFPGHDPIASSVRSARAEHGDRQAAINLSPNCAAEYASRRRSGESSGNPNAIQNDFPQGLLKRWGLAEGTLRLKRQPTNQCEALDWLAYFQSYDIFVDLGLMQVSTAEAKRRGISPESLLGPCTNLQEGWQILEDAYQIEEKIYGPGQEALQHAISCYNTGDPQQGIANGYLARVFAVVRRLQAELPMERR